MLIGVVDPSHAERAHEKPGRIPHWLSLEAVLEKSRQEGPKWSPWSYELINAALGEHQERDYVSTSALTGGCTRSRVLERTEDYIGRLDDMWMTLMGTMVHRTLESYCREDGIAEGRFWTTVHWGNDEIEVSCSPDLVTLQAIWDYKKTENIPTFGYPRAHHTQQVNFNRFIVNNAERWRTNTIINGKAVPIDNGPTPFDFRRAVYRYIVVMYLGPKFPKPIIPEGKVEVTAPNGNVFERKEAQVWTDTEVLEGKGDHKGLGPLAAMFKRAVDNYPEWPEGAEKLWGGEPGYRCPGPPVCWFDCLAKRYPDGLTWENPAPDKVRKVRVG